MAASALRLTDDDAKSSVAVLKAQRQTLITHAKIASPTCVSLLVMHEQRQPNRNAREVSRAIWRRLEEREVENPAFDWCGFCAFLYFDSLP